MFLTLYLWCFFAKVQLLLCLYGIFVKMEVVAMDTVPLPCFCVEIKNSRFLAIAANGVAWLDQRRAIG